MRRDDFVFDGFEHLSKKLGYKNSSVLRKMCEPRGEGSNIAKLGVEDAIILMTEIRDYRLFDFIYAELKTRKQNSEQMNLFSQPQREL